MFGLIAGFFFNTKNTEFTIRPLRSSALSAGNISVGNIFFTTKITELTIRPLRSSALSALFLRYLRETKTQIQKVPTHPPQPPKIQNQIMPRQSIHHYSTKTTK